MWFHVFASPRRLGHRRRLQRRRPPRPHRPARRPRLHLQLLHRARRHRSRRRNAELVHDSGRQTAAFQLSQRLQLLLKGEARALS